MESRAESTPEPNPQPTHHPTTGLALLSGLLCAFGALLALQTLTDSDLMLIPLGALALTIFVAGAVLAARTARARADAARLAELEPLPPADDRRAGGGRA
ncbi:hypothetical protein E1265_10365 [Streptomyces sp. 8K308]|uniref:hypothetical protein n=1 Tax=Streptomyces sp. 8K308 TaxID=2530388 RepID=UPI00104E0758|nr:hypothetical protein [Streptomyces sp. 8K308]TDC24237.1 hypothetical protein E1265_10365 [Streptomyces sp. 8K308]